MWPRTLAPHRPKAAQLLLAAERCPRPSWRSPAHWTRIYSTNTLERLNKEVKRRTNVVEIFPDVPSVLRLVGHAGRSR